MNVGAVVDWLRRAGAPETVEGMTRYGIPNERAFGIAMGEMNKFAKRNAALRAATRETAGRLATSDDRPAAWIGPHVGKPL